jgi:penicillin-binding protein 2A
VLVNRLRYSWAWGAGGINGGNQGNGNGNGNGNQGNDDHEDGEHEETDGPTPAPETGGVDPTPAPSTDGGVDVGENSTEDPAPQEDPADDFSASFDFENPDAGNSELPASNMELPASNTTATWEIRLVIAGKRGITTLDETLLSARCSALLAALGYSGTVRLNRSRGQ